MTNEAIDSGETPVTFVARERSLATVVAHVKKEMKAVRDDEREQIMEVNKNRVANGAKARRRTRLFRNEEATYDILRNIIREGIKVSGNHEADQSEKGTRESAVVHTVSQVWLSRHGADTRRVESTNQVRRSITR